MTVAQKGFSTKKVSPLSMKGVSKIVVFIYKLNYLKHYVPRMKKRKDSLLKKKKNSMLLVKTISQRVF